MLSVEFILPGPFYSMAELYSIAELYSMTDPGKESIAEPELGNQEKSMIGQWKSRREVEEQKKGCCSMSLGAITPSSPWLQ